MQISLKLVSSLEKVFLDQEPSEQTEHGIPGGFRNETISFQAAYAITDDVPRDYIQVAVESPISEAVRVRAVKHVPVRLAAFFDADENYLRKTPGLYPDLLSDCHDHELRAYRNLWNTLWIDVEPRPDTPAGIHPITIKIKDTAGNVLAERTQKVEILDAELPPQTLIHTKWFHGDCLATYYRVAVFSEEYWRIVENFIRAAVKRGINMILTPVHTPPLDTREGGERPTVQLVDVYKDGGKYSFDFGKLRRWVDVCKRAGVQYYEIAHLFTQWGARFTPKIMAVVDGVEKRIFGWDVSATSDEYKEFISCYLPALTQELKNLGIDRVSYFHISDEPGKDHLEHYMAAKAAVSKYLEGFPIMDALSDYDFYKTGAVAKPVPANNHIEPFLEAKVQGLWTYYCVGQYKDVSNMFMAMPSARNRILGVQLYKYGIEGFLQWGYNFYSSQFSDYAIDPYAITDGDGFVPSGDAFQVYPGADGQPEESIRMMVTDEAMNDMRAFAMLEKLAGREFVMELIEGALAEPVTFSRYPKSDGYLLTLRNRVNREIMKRLS